MKLRNALFCAGLAAFSAQAGTVFKVVGPDGKVSYVDRPPQNKAAKVTAMSFAAYDTVTPVPRAAASLPTPSAPAQAPADSSQRLVMYSTQNCGYCRKAKQYLGGKGIAYEELDVDQNAAALQEFRRLGGKGVPLFVYKGRTMSGYSESGLEGLLRL
jgi:glutaredoxin